MDGLLYIYIINTIKKMRSTASVDGHHSTGYSLHGEEGSCPRARNHPSNSRSSAPTDISRAVTMMESASRSDKVYHLRSLVNKPNAAI